MLLNDSDCCIQAVINKDRFSDNVNSGWVHLVVFYFTYYNRVFTSFISRLLSVFLSVELEVHCFLIVLFFLLRGCCYQCVFPVACKAVRV